MPGGPPATIYARRSGTVGTFDAHVGAGTVADDADGTEWWFHGTSLADGSRHIEVGVPVTYRVATGPTGLEAVVLTALSSTKESRSAT